MEKDTKAIRISTDIHKKLRIYAAKAELNIVDVVDQSVINFMKEFSAEFLRDCTRKPTTKSKK